MCDVNGRLAIADPGGGAANQLFGNRFAKLHEKKEFGLKGCVPSAPPLGSATDLVLSMFNERCCKTLHFTCIFCFIYFDHRCCVHIVQTQTLRTFLVKLLSTRLVISLIFSFGTLCLDLEETLLYLVTLALHHTKKPLRQRTMWH